MSCSGRCWGKASPGNVKRRTQEEFPGLCHCSTSLVSLVPSSRPPISPLLASQTQGKHGQENCRVSAFAGHGTKWWMLTKEPVTLLSLSQLFWLPESSYCRHGVLRDKYISPQPAGRAGDARPASLLQAHPSIPSQGDGTAGTTGGGSSHESWSSQPGPPEGAVLRGIGRS